MTVREVFVWGRRHRLNLVFRVGAILSVSLGTAGVRGQPEFAINFAYLASVLVIVAPPAMNVKLGWRGEGIVGFQSLKVVADVREEICQGPG